MLKSLTIKNYALIDDLELQPSAKLNMITGETGAGKSIMLGAVSLLLGNRADTKVLLFPDQKCVIEGIFDVGNYGLESFFKEEDLDFDSTCIIRREINPSGKSRSFVNDTPVLLDTLKKLGVALMDVHSQHDSLRLGDGSYQLSLVDAFAEASQLRKDYQAQFEAYLNAKSQMEKLHQEALQLKKEADFNEFQLNELSELGLKSGEQEEIEEELELLENSEEIQAKVQEALELIRNENFGVSQSLNQLSGILDHLADLSGRFSSFAERLKSLNIELNDIEDSIESESSGIEVNFEHLEELRERISRIYQLQKKHGLSSVEELLGLEKELAEKVFQVQNLDEALAESKRKFENSKAELHKKADILSELRESCFDDFEKRLSELLGKLGMPNSRVKITNVRVEPNSSGQDQLEFLFSANKGSDLQPFKKVASGGEFSRFLFAIKYLMAEKMALPTLIFDEIDTGISGEVALQMVRMMKEMSSRHQIICITHLPQVAGKGDSHFFVYKEESSERTLSKIKELDPEGRIEELAKMIAGARPSDSAINSAKELLNS